MRPEQAAMSDPHWLAVLARVLAEEGAQAGAEGEHPSVLACEGLADPLAWCGLHAWYADVVVPLLGDALADQRPALDRLQSLHRRAALGVYGGRGEWRAALAPVLQPLYRRAYAYEAAYAQAYQSALHYAAATANAESLAEDFDSAESFARYYAHLSTEANAGAFASAHAAATLELAASAFAQRDGDAYAAIASAMARVCVCACAREPAQRLLLYQHLAAGLLGCLTLSIRPRNTT
ncbi:hypothetical protein [Pseudomonas sp. RIT-PI-S]|uniref:hypothetical protein n=1 Tax=Pseudomonas sp. RIT-PI-S TaxID=3035295 RepID=UPI0021D88FF9|nr:hypothetical protein [Pseudomonas sp. RIT-PI-S]